MYKYKIHVTSERIGNGYVVVYGIEEVGRQQAKYTWELTQDGNLATRWPAPSMEGSVDPDEYTKVLEYLTSTDPNASFLIQPVEEPEEEEEEAEQLYSLRINDVWVDGADDEYGGTKEKEGKKYSQFTIKELKQAICNWIDSVNFVHKMDIKIRKVKK